MSSTNKGGSLRSWSFSVAILSLFTLCLSGIALGQTFPGAGTGMIPDRGMAGCGLPAGPDIDVTFTVAGLPAGPPSNVSVDMDFTHSWVGDLEVSLIAPDLTTHIIFASTGSTTATGCGSGDDLAGVYNFDNTGTGDWWTLGNPYPVGTYAVPGGGAVTDMNAAFAGIPDSNGTWTLRINDSGGGDTGSINAANLTLTVDGGGGDPDTDFDGDGTSDYAVTRDETPSAVGGNFLDKNSLNYAAQRSSSNLRENRRDRKADSTSKTNNLGLPPAGTNRVWYAANSGTPGTFNIAGLGSQGVGEQITPADFDGDGSDDFAVWRPEGATAFFFILNSSDSTVSTVEFGLNGDEVGIVGDYDGDGKADPAVYRQPGAAPFGQTTFFYKGSAGGGEITFVPWGDNSTEDLRAVRGDYDGDGKHDFVIHRTSTINAGKGQYVILRSSDSGVEYVEYGNSGDLLFPGDIDGDGMADFIKVRVESGAINWFVMTKDGSRIDGSPTTWGTISIAGTSEFAAIADYDGDGKDDLAVYRRDNVDPDNCFYYILRSSDGMLQTYEFGATTDTPVQVWDQQF